jgi:hypothetical protein
VLNDVQKKLPFALGWRTTIIGEMIASSAAPLEIIWPGIVAWQFCCCFATCRGRGFALYLQLLSEVRVFLASKGLVKKNHYILVAKCREGP